MKSTCSICDKECIITPVTSRDYNTVKCDRCGNYSITEEAIAEIAHPRYVDKKYILSGYLRDRSNLNNPVFISSYDIENIFLSAPVPNGALETIDLILLYVDKNSKRKGEKFPLDISKDYPIAYAKDREEFGNLLRISQDLNYFEKDNMGRYRIIIDGWKRIDELRKKQPESNKAFVAMWFPGKNKESIYQGRSEEEWRKLLDEGYKSIEKALIDTGYKDPPFRVDLIEHNNKICDKIIANIRKSGIVIADLTGQRQGVYFEAGFAMRSGTEVIWTCHDDDFDNRHFDVDHYNTIRWKDAGELHKKLINRIGRLGLDHPK